MYRYQLQTKQGTKIEATFGDRDTGAEYPLGVLPLVQAFAELDGCRVVGMKHNANLVPSWERCHGAIQITKHHEGSHHGAVVCLRTPYSKQVDLVVDGVRVFSRPGQKGIACVTTPGTECPDLTTAYRQSIALCQALIATGAQGGRWWSGVEKQLRKKMATNDLFNSTLTTAKEFGPQDIGYNSHISYVII